MATLPHPDPPEVGKVNHHSIQLYWDINHRYPRRGPSSKWFTFSLELEEPKTRAYGTIYSGYSLKHVLEGLEPITNYRFRLKVTACDGEYAYSSVVSVSTLREPMNGEHLHRAVNMNNEEAARNVLQIGCVKADIPDKLGFTPLMVAAQKGYLGMVRLLVEHGADLQQENGSGKNSLMLACFSGHLDIVKYLRNQGASWGSQDKGGCTPMHWAADGGHVELIKWMINDGCQAAGRLGCWEMKLPRSCKLAATRRNSKKGGISVLSGCRIKCEYKGFLLTLDSTDESGCSHWKHRGCTMFNAGAEVNVKDKNGKTPLMVATLSNYEHLVRLLIESGADCCITNEYGISIAEMAKAFNRQNMVLMLEENMKERCVSVR